MSVGPATPNPSSQNVQGWTVICQQCGAANMTRLDRKEYRCNHCGAVTVISDNDAEHLEHLLKQMIGQQQRSAQPIAQPLPANTGSGGTAVALSVAGVVFLAAVLCLAAFSIRPSSRPSPAVTTTADSYFQHTTVPTDRVVMSPLEWVPDGKGGTYNGLIYNHSGYPIMPPSYTLALFHNDIKDDSSGSIHLLATMEPGEYAPVSFRVETARPNARYELVQPERIMRSTFEVAPVKLQEPALTRDARLPHYYLTGLIRNTLKRPFTGIGLVMLYSADGRLVGSGIGSIDDLNPGEATRITMNGFLFHENAEVASYEYLLDMFYKNERESVSIQDVERLGSTTVPNRIVRVNNPHIAVLPEDDGFLKH